jgi:hypothetical protein
MGSLRLLTNEHVMRKRAASSQGAFKIMDSLLRNPDIRFAPEPSGIEGAFGEIQRVAAVEPKSLDGPVARRICVNHRLHIGYVRSGLRPIRPHPPQYSWSYRLIHDGRLLQDQT